MRLAPVLLATALLLTGCSGDEPAPSTSASEGGGGGSAEDAGVEPFDPDDVLVQQTLADVRDERSTLQVGITSLEVQDRVMRLELVVTPQVASLSDDEAVSFYDLRSFFDSPMLLDRDNLKRYSVVRAGPGQRYQSDPVSTKTVNGRPMRLYFYFAAPEDEVEAFDVVLSDTYPAFTDVPVER